ncbi:MocR-like pyridoxine biosynthesis transcription factor PdxR [Streptomyces sp. SP18CS02]|uniref:MocR-like pyridoxine biosynthesis transcription factor PdxR n=1 Tax=Streptomyces sp. SP18CS02 TaxID=3002531 RepID=UPI002E786DBC|nr:PLP-dependent aminotransferase family protein [Streptomyces sp. SP18CS02]MEE1756144.1 PLP-dependent aminotransferase family protein [Streptomyces sp. SP18CS02]
MTDPWATSEIAGPVVTGADLHLEVRGPGLRAGLMDALREAVRTGRLAPGTRLPSSRSLAGDLGIARNTVADAYAELVAEGWLTAQQGSGTRVAPRAAPRRPAPPSRAPAGRRTPVGGADPASAGRPLAAPAGGPAPAPAGRRPGRVRPGPVHTLHPGTPDLGSFPRADWLKAARRALSAAPNEAFGYGDPLGRIELRTVLAEYLARARGVYAHPGRIVICSGFVHGLMLMGRVLRERRVHEVAVESYGLDVHWNLLTEAGLRTPALPLDEHGTRTDRLGREGAVLITPAHQFPIGGALPPRRRAAAVDWARGAGGLILEDDYDGEFRYDRQPVGALQGLDPERVVYLGTSSKSLTPGLRLAWMVLPEDLVPEVLAAKGAVDWASSALDQLTLAEFISSGAYDRHVRGMRLRYRRRRDQLVAALAERAPDVRVSGIAAGLHAVLELPPGTEQSVVQAAAWQGLALQGLDRFRHPSVRRGRDALVVGYGTPTDSAWAGALDALCRVLP